MKSTGIVTGIISNLVTVRISGHVAQNEICYINLGGTKLMAEVIKVNGQDASVQVYESTRGLKQGDTVEFEGHMLEVTLGPGLLSSSYDGLQNNLETMSDVFLKRGEYTSPLDHEKLWHFVPIAKKGETVIAADWLGEVKEGWLPHKIMVPFSFKGEYKIKSLAPEGDYTIDETIAVLTNAEGDDVNVTMTQKWPVKVAVGGYVEKPRPYRIMETGVRCIDTMNPIAEGGTGFIPGPFGCGKTVLQHAIAQQGDAEVIVMAA
ncbi:MAG: V-type ATP synthase subunit A, partial [Bacteroidales bacterium]|nr:V-type ATP synthase subunit A [Bacteroidales bacterium]